MRCVILSAGASFAQGSTNRDLPLFSGELRGIDDSQTVAGDGTCTLYNPL
jgi:hypothetical protein